MDNRLELIALGIDQQYIHSNDDQTYFIHRHINWEDRLPKQQIPRGIYAVYGNLNLSRNSLQSLENTPEIVTGIFDCSHNNLTSFKHGPKFVGKLLAMANSNLSSLDYAPVLGQGLMGDLYTTKVHPEHVLFYRWANQSGTWNSYLTFDENVYFNCMNYPKVFDNHWDVLLPYRGEKSDARGRAIGNDLGLI